MEFGMNDKKRAGVSLVTVLMFMLVATIAATATYKWITSEGHSSASRMMQREAYQSAVAGIENTRAWMTFHANDVGALIRQYIYDLNSDKAKAQRRPINLDQQVRVFGNNNGNQDHHVWLTGVNTENGTYKVKILSEGISRDGQARHTEVAIFNVSGLYQVDKPLVTVKTESNLDFNYAYFGGSISGGGTSDYESVIINGDWGSNPPKSDKDWIVTGDVTLSGSDMSMGRLICIGGDTKAGNAGISGQDLFIGGDASESSFNINGSAYFGGDVGLNSTNAKSSCHGDKGCNLWVGGDVYLKGFMTDAADQHGDISGNFCVDKDGALVLTLGNGDKFIVNGNVWMPGKQNLAYGTVSKTTTRSGCTCGVYEYTCVYQGWYTGSHKDCKDEDSWKLVSRDRVQKGTTSCNDGDPDLLSCATETVTRIKNYSENLDANINSQTPQGYMQIIMGGSGKKAYIRSAHPSSEYGSVLLAANDNITESGKRDCPASTRFRIIGSNNWEAQSSGRFKKKTVNEGEGLLVCGKLEPIDDEGVPITYNDGWGSDVTHEWTYYTKGWSDWSGNKAPDFYPDGRAAYDDKYYIFDYSQDQGSFIAFEKKTLSSNEWRKFAAPSGVTARKTGDTYIIPMWQNGDNDKFDNYFLSDVDNVGQYKVGGKYFYDVAGDSSVKFNYEGSRIVGSPFCKNSSGNESKNRPLCGVTPWFKSNGTVESDLPASAPFACADSVEQKCKKIWGDKRDTKKCEADYFVEDPIEIPLDDLEDFASDHSDACPNAKKWDNTLVSTLNTCYSTLYGNETDRKTKLYNGEYLVVKIQGSSSLNLSDETQTKGTLVGKFVIIVESKVVAQGEMLTCSDNGITGQADPGSYAFIYLKKGATGLLGSKKTVKHLFIYMLEGFGGDSQIDLTGTLYFPADSCIHSSFNNASLFGDSLLLHDLNINGIVCNKGETCGPSAQNPDGNTTTTTTFGANGKDPYYISMAPQLGVTLESQYESSETVPVVDAANGISPLGQSFIVLPRIVYLTKDPYGKLSDYFNVLPLNGADVSKATTNVTCSPSLNISTNLVSGDAQLEEGLYNCTAAADGYKSVPFYVWVKGTLSAAPPINFLEGSANLTANESHSVIINLPPHSQDIDVMVKVSDVPTGWTLTAMGNVTPENSVYKFHFAASTEHSNRELFTLRPPADATNGSVSFVLQPGQGYQLASPWVSTLLMASTATLTNNKDAVTASDISAFCEKNENAEICPEISMIGNWNDWPDCPIINSTAKEWVKPDWPPKFSTQTKNRLWDVVTSGSGTLKLQEGADASECVVIIPPGADNSREAPILANESITLRATAKAKLNKIGIKFAGNISDIGSPSVRVVAGGRVKVCNYIDKETVCPVDVFDGEKVFISTDHQEFSYWTCDNNGGTTCPITEPISSKTFGVGENDADKGFYVKDNNAIVYAHFGESDQHCFFDEFNRTRKDNTTHSCSSDSETETAYCIGEGENAKWKLTSGEKTDDIEREPYQGYVVASKSAPKEGVKVMSTVRAGIQGTLKVLFQPPHATASYGKDSPKIRNSGFLLRALEDGSSFLMLNVYENVSGNLAARVCIDASESCSDEIELLNGSFSRASVTTSSMVMLSATLDGKNSLVVKAYKDNFYSSGIIEESSYYKAEFDLSVLGNNHSLMNYQYVGFSLADRDFKIYGIGWKSEDYGSECHDTYPIIKCSFAAVAKDGVVPTYGSDLGQSENYQQPWVGHSGWFDSKDCRVSYSYVPGASNDNTGNSTDGFRFLESGAGAHGYRDNNGNDVKTAYATLANCKYAETDVLAWQSTVDPAHCGPFWTGKYNECQADVSLLANERTVISGENYVTPSFTAKDLRGVKDFVITLSNDYDDVDLEVWLISNSAAWGGEDHESRHVRITGSGPTITAHFSVAANGSDNEDLADNAAGFDPENVTAIAFRNNGSNSVTVKSAEAQCKNTVRFDGCTAVRAGETEWKVTLSVPENSDKLSKIRLKADVDGGSYLSDIERDYVGLEYGVSDPEAFSNAGKTYTFSAQVYSQVNNFTSEWVECSCNGDCSVGAITCGDASIAHTKLNSSNEIEYGEGSPEYSFKLSGCPDKGCAYEIYLDGTKVSECTNAEAASTGCSKNPHVVGGQMGVSDTPHKYEVRNPAGSKTEIKSLAACDKTFKVVEHVKDPVTCSITSGTTNASAADLGSSAEIPSNKISVSCPEAETSCTYTVKENGSSVGSANTYSDGYGFSFTGATEAGSHTYTASVTRDSEGAVDCSGSYTINYPLNLECDTWTDPGASTPVAAGTTITPVKTKAGSSNTSHTGCGGNCKYNITKGGTSVYGGEVSSYDGYSATNTFTDANGSGKVTYTLTVSHPDVATTKSCNFDVTYATPSSSSVASSSSAGGCTCIAFVNGVGGYDKHCYNSGLQNMATGKCYTMNPDRASDNPTWINDDAVQTWWWTEVSCTNWTGCSGGGGGGSSSSAAPSSSSAAPASSAGGGGGCHCTDYCTQSQCNNLKKSGTFNFDGSCYFATSIGYINGSVNHTINGKTYSGYSQMCCNGYPDPVDGGYYIKVESGSNYGSSVTLGNPTCN